MRKGLSFILLLSAFLSQPFICSAEVVLTDDQAQALMQNLDELEMLNNDQMNIISDQKNIIDNQTTIINEQNQIINEQSNSLENQEKCWVKVTVNSSVICLMLGILIGFLI